MPTPTLVKHVAIFRWFTMFVRFFLALNYAVAFLLCYYKIISIVTLQVPIFQIWIFKSEY